MGGSGARKGKEREKGQWEKECKIKRVKEGLHAQKKSQLHAGSEESKRKKSTEKPKSAKKKKGQRRKKSLGMGGVRWGSSREERDVERKESEEEEESVRARGD